MRNKGRIYLVDDDELIISMLSRMLKNSGYDVRIETSTTRIVGKINAWSPDIVLLDIRIGEQSGIDVLKELAATGSQTQVVMLTADDTAETAVKAMKLGAVDYLTKPFNFDEVKIVLQNIIERGRLQQEVVYLRKAHSEAFESEIIGRSRQLEEIKDKIRRMAEASVSTILITGESGTGKELFARYAHGLLHNEARNGYAPFIKVNCAAIPESLLESELFGHEKGAFTDAKTDKKGLFELAHRGSILLDEIGDMKQNLQGKLLRVLEDRKVRPVGGSEEIPIDVTIIATTNADLKQAVQTGAFRMDLFYRLSAFHLHIPPLRDRKEDVTAIIEHYLSSFVTQYKRQATTHISPDAYKCLLAYHWPGNIRELRNLLERLVVLEGAEEILPDHLPSWLICKTGDSFLEPGPGARIELPEQGISIEALEKDFIIQALQRTNNNKTQAAKILGLSYDAFRYQVKKFGLE